MFFPGEVDSWAVARERASFLRLHFEIRLSTWQRLTRRRKTSDEGNGGTAEGTDGDPAGNTLGVTLCDSSFAIGAVNAANNAIALAPAAADGKSLGGRAKVANGSTAK